MSLASSVDKALELAAKDFAYEANATQLSIDAFLDNPNVATETIVSLTEAGQLTQIPNILNGWGSKIVRIINESYDVAFSNGMIDFTEKETGDDPDEELMWRRHPPVKSCPDCLVRGGQVKTREEWRLVGEPSDGLTVCGGKCHCSLDPLDALT